MEFAQNQSLVTKRDIYGQYIGGYGSAATIPAGTEVVIQKVNAKSVWVRGASSAWGNQVVTIPFGALDRAEEFFVSPDPNAPKPRKLGEVPEGGISPDDPRLAWLWEDAAKVANKAGHCRTYDDLCDQIGIPGREREFKVTRKIGEFSVQRSFKARSKKLAEDMFDTELKEQFAVAK